MSRQRQAILRVLALEEAKKASEASDSQVAQVEQVVPESTAPVETATTPVEPEEQSVKKKFPFQKKKKSVPQE